MAKVWCQWQHNLIWFQCSFDSWVNLSCKSEYCWQEIYTVVWLSCDHDIYKGEINLRDKQCSYWKSKNIISASRKWQTMHHTCIPANHLLVILRALLPKEKKSKQPSSKWKLNPTFITSHFCNCSVVNKVW